MRRASLIMILILGLTGCKERYNSLAGPDEPRFVAAGQSASVDAAPSSRGRRRAVAGPLLQIQGHIKSVSPDTLVVTSVKGEEVTLQVNADTNIRHGGLLITTADLEEGDKVHVMAKVVEGIRVAVEVRLQEEEAEPEEGTTATANGLVVSVGMDELTVRTVPHGDVVVRVDSNTLIRRQGVIISLSDIQVDWEVNTRGTRIDAQTIQAVHIEVRGNSKKR